jgi:hypothetical protein
MKSQVNLSKKFKLYILILGIGLSIGLAIPLIYSQQTTEPVNRSPVNVSVDNETCIEYNITGFCYNENGEYELPENSSNNLSANESVNQSSK